MAEQPAQDRTEKATTHRRNKAVEEGSVARSMDVNSVAVLFAGILALQFTAWTLLDTLSRFTIETYRQAAMIEFNVASVVNQTIAVLMYFLPVIAPILLLIMLAGLGANYAQVGFVFAAKALMPKFDKLNPLKGMKNLFSIRSLAELIKGLFKTLIVGWIGYAVIKKHLPDFWILTNVTVGETLLFIARVMLEIYIKIGLALVVLAAADFIYQKWQYEKSIRMTKQEVKDESKQFENPEVKSRIRSVQRQMARRRMMAAVPSATVVVTNPTFIAIALRYEPKNKADAPKVIAKGKRKVAEKIREIAALHQVPIIENKTLARSLFDAVEVGMEIPFYFYEAVAEVIAQVYKMKKARIPLGVN